MDSEAAISFPSSITRWWSEETVAVVTGANKGIGLALVRRLAELGLTVVLTSRDEGRGLAAVEALRARGLPVQFRRLDVADPASIDAFASWLRRRFRSLDILVNNAGVSFHTVGGENTVEHAETVIRTNFYGARRLTEALLPLFRRSPAARGRVLNVSSELGLITRVRDPRLRAALQDEESLSEETIEGMLDAFLRQVKDGTWRDRGWPRVWTDYAVSKLALNAHSRLMARRHAGDGPSVNCFCPGYTRTDMTGGRGHHTAEEAAEVAARLVLLPPGELPTGKFFKWGNPPVRCAM